MRKAVETLFKNSFDSICPFCKKQYTSQNLPTIMCSNQHTCCITCMRIKLKQKKMSTMTPNVAPVDTKCPEYNCTKSLYSQQKPQIQTFGQALKFREDIINILLLEQTNSTLKINSNKDIQRTADDMFSKAEQLFLISHFSECLDACKEIIRIKPTKWGNFKCFGHPGQFWGCNTLAYVQFYNRHIASQRNRSVYDLLNLCLLLGNQYKREQQWLLDELQKNLVAIELYMALGILHYTQSNREKTKYFFSMVCKMNNQYDAYYQLKAFNLLFKFPLDCYVKPKSQWSVTAATVYSEFLTQMNDNTTKYYEENMSIQIKEEPKFTQKVEILEFFQQGNDWQRKKSRIYFLLQINPYYYPAYYILGKGHLNLQNYQMAMKSFEKYLEYVNPKTINEMKTQFYLAYCYAMVPKCSKSKLISAIKYVNDFIVYTEKRQEKVTSQAYWVLAKIYLEFGNLKNAKEMLEVYNNKWKQDHRSNIPTFGSFFRMYDDQNERSSSKYNLLKAQILRQESNFREAIRYYQKYLESCSTDKKAKEQLIDVLLRSEQLQKAKQVYEKLQIKSNSILFKFGLAYQKRQMDIQAIEYFLKCFNSDPEYAENTQILQYVCVKLETLKRFQEAQIWGKKWNQLCPDQTRAKKFMNRISSILSQKDNKMGYARKLQHFDNYYKR